MGNNCSSVPHRYEECKQQYANAVSVLCLYSLLIATYSFVLVKTLVKTKLYLLAVTLAIWIGQFATFMVYLWLSYQAINYEEKRTSQFRAALYVFEGLTYACQNTGLWLFVSRYWRTATLMQQFVEQREETKQEQRRYALTSNTLLVLNAICPCLLTFAPLFGIETKFAQNVYFDSFFTLVNALAIVSICFFIWTIV